MPIVMLRIFLPLLFSLLFSPASTAELKGKVIGVTDTQVRISVEGELLPQVGDVVAISFQLPGGPLVRVGTWKVSEVKPEFIEATLAEATGKPTVDQIATINSSDPTRRSTTTASSPQPGTRGILGIEIRNVHEVERGATTVPSGVLVVGVTKDSPAERAGLKPGDTILNLNDRPVVSEELQKAIASSPQGQTVVLRVLRAGETRDYHAVVGSLPEQPGVSMTVRAKILFKGQVYDTRHMRLVMKDRPIDYYFYKTPPVGGVAAVVNNKQLENQFLRNPASDHPDQSNVNWAHNVYIYKNGQWELIFMGSEIVEVLERYVGPAN